MTFEKYAHIIDNLLKRHWAVAETQVNVKRISPNFGRIDGKIILLDGSYIDFQKRFGP